MDKKSILGIVVVAVLFLGFAYFNSQQQKEYLEQKGRVAGLSGFGRPQPPAVPRRTRGRFAGVG